MNLLRTTGLLFWCAGLAAATWLMLRLALPYTGFEKNVDFLLTKQNVYHLGYWRWSFYAHVFASVLMLPAGFTQFNGAFFGKALHRRLGMIYVFVVLFVSAPTGFLMGLHANGGLPSRASFLLLSSLWFTTTLFAFRTAKQRRFAEHGEWMLYSYSLALSAITFRLIALGFDLFDIRVPPREAYVTASWLSWVPNLLVAHLLVKTGFAKRLFKRYLQTAQASSLSNEKSAAAATLL